MVLSLMKLTGWSPIQQVDGALESVEIRKDEDENDDDIECDYCDTKFQDLDDLTNHTKDRIIFTCRFFTLLI